LFLAVAGATARPLASVTPTPTAWRLEGTGGRAPGSPAPSSQVAGAAVGRAGIGGVWQMAPAMDISRSTPLGRSMPCVEALALPSPRPPATHGVALPPSDAQIMAAHLGLSCSDRVRPIQSNPIQSNPIQGSHASALSPHTSPLSTGWRGWGGGTIRRHGWRLMVPMDGFTAGPAPPPTASRLASSWNAAFAFGVRLGAGRGRHGICPRSPLNTRPVILRLSRRPRGH